MGIIVQTIISYAELTYDYFFLVAAQ